MKVKYPISSFPIETITAAVAASTSYVDVYRNLGYDDGPLNGGNVSRIKNLLAGLGISTAHFTGKSAKQKPERTLDDLLTYGSGAQTQTLKRRMLLAGLLEYRCSGCGISDWQGKFLSLQLDHIDGDHKNNARENLRLLCPNCHAQTDSYGGKNVTDEHSTFVCGCGKAKTYNAKTCRACRDLADAAKRVAWPTLEDLVARLRVNGTSAVARALDCSTKAIGQHLRRQGVRLGEVVAHQIKI